MSRPSSAESATLGASDGGFWGSALFQSWLRRRIPPVDSITLNRTNIFILPTREGFLFCLMLVLMLVAAINYQNSLIFAFAFLLGSLFMVSMIHTFRNLSGLVLSRGVARPAFAGEDAEFTIILSHSGNRQYEAIHLCWPESPVYIADLVDESEIMVHLYAKSISRGVLKPGRLHIQTWYPVGLFRAWSWVDLGMQATIYPRPLQAGLIPRALNEVNEGELLDSAGVDDFYGLKEYQPGDPMRHIAWKSYARTGELISKQFAAFVDRRVWLDWEYFAGMDTETILSRLCYWVIQLSRSGDEYGLRLPGIEIGPGRSDEHREQVLHTLAMFESQP